MCAVCLLDSIYRIHRIISTTPNKITVRTKSCHNLFPSSFLRRMNIRL